MKAIIIKVVSGLSKSLSELFEKKAINKTTMNSSKIDLGISEINLTKVFAYHNLVSESTYSLSARLE